jgi:hypothetical protein
LTRFAKNRITLAVLGAWLLYWPVTYVIDRHMLLEFVNGMIAALSVGITLAFFPGAWRALRERPYQMSGAHLLVLGINLVQISIVGLFTWGWVYRLLDKPYWMVDHLFRGWLVYLLFIGGLLHLMAADIDHDAMPSRGWLHVCAAIAAGLGVAVVLLLFVGR